MTPVFHALRAAALSILLAWASVQVAAQAPEKLVIKSHTPQDYADVLSGRYRQAPVEIHGFLTLPAGAGRFPAVVIVPGSGGYRQWMQDGIARRLNEAGIATLILDSFTGRGVTETASNQASIPMPASVVDGYAALQALAQRPDIDPMRIGITGFSRGGVVAMFTQERKLLAALGLADLRFAAHLPFYPSCSTTFDKPDPTPTPILFLMGEKDDYTPASQCTGYLARLKAAGANLDAKVYPGAHHGWVSDSDSVTYLSRVQVFSKCDGRVDDAGVIREVGSGATSAEGWSNFVAKVWRACGKWGAHYGGNAVARNESLGDMVRFFSGAFRRTGS